MTAPSHLPPVRRPRPSGIHSSERAPWWGKRDLLCIFAVLLGMAAFILGLIGALPHVSDDAVKIINALHGTAPEGPGDAEKAETKRTDTEPEGELSDHAPSMPSIFAASTPTPGAHP